MGSQHTPADDLVYDLVSIQYHALQAAQTYAKYLEDAADHEDVVEFIRPVPAGGRPAGGALPRVPRAAHQGRHRLSR